MADAKPKQIGKVEPRILEEEMQASYLDYAMSVIVARALPDVRDGLKPVHRRILYSMSELGLTHAARYRKSATVVGDVLGKYHPHGDIAVYDSLVRMAQPFSMRYQLVDGQGNFGCFTGDTKIKLVDGRTLSFKQLIRLARKGERLFGYTFNNLSQKIEIAELLNPRKTKKNSPLCKIRLDNRQEITCTPDHRFMLRDGSYHQAIDLKPQDSLMPVYTRLSSKQDDPNIVGYEMVYQPFNKSWDYSHHLADQWNLAAGSYQKSAGRIRHHIDFNKRNNSPLNLTRIDWKKHWQIHYQLTATRHQNDPEYRRKLAAGRKRYLTNKAVLARISERLSRRNIRNWQNSRYRKRMAMVLSKLWRDPFYKKRMARIASVNFKRTWKKHGRYFAQLKSAELKQRWQDAIYRESQADRMRELSAAIWSNPKHRQKISRLMKHYWQDPQRRLAHAIQSKQNWKKPEYRSKFPKDHFRTMAIQLWKDQRTRDLHRAKAKTQWQDPVFRKKMIKAVSESNRRRLINDPTMMLRLAKKASQPYNHKVVSVQLIEQREDVYDLTVEGTHNFALSAGIFAHNSVDGDNAAAMRYTEARMSRLAQELLADIEKDTVDFTPNYDGTRKEPLVLPSSIPNLLLNGSLGIAVGMATNIPTHNLTEVCDATVALIDNPEVTVEELMERVKGPDFPTGGMIYDIGAIRNAYTTGKGSIVMRAVATIEQTLRDFRIIVSELPYQVVKADLVAKIAELVKDKKLEGISDIRDESDRKEGVRIVIELKQNAYPKKVLNRLYELTPMQSAFHVNMVALVEGIVPRLLNLKDILSEFIKHRQVVIARRANFDLAQAKDRAHILEGLKIALDQIDAVIQTIKQAKDRPDALRQLIKKFELTERQANAILDMRLAQLTSLERAAVDQELTEKYRLIKELQALLKDPKKVLAKIKEELRSVKTHYGDERRTKINPQPLSKFEVEDLIANEQMIVTLTRGNYIKRVPVAVYRSQGRGGKGVIGMETREEDVIEHLTTTWTHNSIYLFTNLGRVFTTKVFELPQVGRAAKGQALVNFIALAPDEKVTTIQAASGKAQQLKGHFFMATKRGVVKKTPVEAYANIRKSGLIAVRLNSGDELAYVKVTSGNDRVMLVSRDGQAIYFEEANVRPMGRAAAGVRGIRLREGDQLISMDVVSRDDQVNAGLLTVLENGYGKRTQVNYFRDQSRGGVGVKAAKVTTKTGKLVTAQLISSTKGDLVLVSAQGQIIRIPLSSAKQLGRDTQGVRLIRLRSGDRVASATVIIKAELENEEPAPKPVDRRKPKGPTKAAPKAAKRKGRSREINWWGKRTFERK